MTIISAELSGKATAKATPTRTEGYTKCSQGQSIGDEIILPRGRAYSMSRKGMPILRRKFKSEDKKLHTTHELPTLSTEQLLQLETTLKGLSS